MFRKNYLIFVLMITAVLFGSMATFAQNSSVSGRVQIEEKAGKKPVANVLVEVYRTDTRKVAPVSATTDEKGDFKIENLPSGKKFALAVSGEGIEVSVITDVASDATNVVVTVKPGNGKQPSTETVFQSLLAGGKLEISEAEKKEAEEELKKAEAKNVRAANFNQISKRSIDEGNKAYKDKNYDLAIKSFEEGYQADTEFLGSAPTFLNNKAAALKMRGLDYSNKSITSGADREAKTDYYNKAMKDFGDAIDAYYMSWMLFKNATDAQQSEIKTFKEERMNTLDSAASLMELAVKAEKVEPEKTEKAKELTEAYVKFESDQAKKSKAQAVLGNYYRYAGDFDSAIAEFRKVLATSPKDPNALFGLGITLIITGYNEDGSIKKSVIQEGVNYLDRFKDVASSKDFARELADANSTLSDQKVANNITPKN